MTAPGPIPDEIKLRSKSRVLTLSYPNGDQFELSAELLRVYSPSAEVRGHGPGQGVLQTGKERVAIERIEPVGHYAVKLFFDDGHDSGLYTWDYLYEIGTNATRYWTQYLEALTHAGVKRREFE